MKFSKIRKTDSKKYFVVFTQSNANHIDTFYFQKYPPNFVNCPIFELEAS